MSNSDSRTSGFSITVAPAAAFTPGKHGLAKGKRGPAFPASKPVESALETPACEDCWDFQSVKVRDGARLATVRCQACTTPSRRVEIAGAAA